ncbi:MAG: MFS transporter, partial [Anaerolineaceae bacterium]|nr:MFS transporter [Anaerolineaceae bacterium]
KSALSLLTRNLWIFILTMVLANIAGEMYLNMLPLYLKSLDANIVQVGLFFTVAAILPLILQIIGGWISDNLGRLRSIAIGSTLGVFSYFGVILAPTWQWVLAGHSLQSITRALVGPSFGAFIAEETPEENRARVFGVTNVVYALVAVIGPPLGGWLADTYGFKIMLAVAWFLYTIATVIRIRMAKQASKSGGKESNPTKLSVKNLGKSLWIIAGFMLSGGLLTWLLITDGARDISYTMSFQLLPIYLKDNAGLGYTEIGWLTSISGVASMLIGIPAGWFADKKGERPSIVIGFVLELVALILFITMDGFIWYAVIWALFGMAGGIMSPAYQSLLSKAIPEKMRGTAFGLIDSSLGLFSLPAPAIGGYLWERFSPLFPVKITAGIVMLSILPVALRFKITKRDRDAMAVAESKYAELAPASQVDLPNENS